MANAFVLRSTGKVVSKMYEQFKRISFLNDAQDDLEISEKTFALFLRYHTFFHIGSSSSELLRNLIYYFYIHVDPEVMESLKILQSIAQTHFLSPANCMAQPGFARAMEIYCEKMRNACLLRLGSAVRLEELVITLKTPQIHQFLNVADLRMENEHSALVSFVSFFFKNKKAVFFL